ncbi:outer membrane protein [Yoonia maricola]|uniref:Outer membrane protein n=1 Tax=Yoonia maricola TaxID=420999 RepID=A0A2M8WP49_9RHOB|nr:TolC family outer membrane protein [Yoonia maricola]PJI92712.1 outer membrane protein [Yoonia maricola]
MIKRKGLATIAIVLSFAAAPALKADTLAEALTAAYNNSGLLEQNRALLRAADEGVAQSVAATLPVISWSITAERTRTETELTSIATTDSVLALISANLTLYDFGVNRLGIDAQKEVVLGTRQTLRGIEQDVLLRGVQAYMSVRSTGEFVQLRQNNVRVITQEFRAAQDRFEVGEVTRTDVALAEARLAAARSELASAQGDLAQAIEEYQAAVGRAPGGPRAVSPAPVSRTIDDAKAFAVRNHPDILEAQHTVSAAELNILGAEAAKRPTVGLESFVSVDEESNRTAQVGVSISGPIYLGGSLLSQIREAQANRDASRASLLQTTIAIEQEVGNAFASLQVAQASRQASEQQIRAAQVAFDGVREEATLGSRTTLEVLNAEQELLDAQTNRIAAQASEVIASYALLSAMGLLTADHLNLPVQQYDPSEYYNLVKDSPSALSSQGAALDRVLEAIGKD